MNRNDVLWKGILEDTFEDFLRFLIQDADLVFDLSRKIEYLDKELDQLFDLEPEDNKTKVRHVDKLAKVHTHQGTEAWILVHVEVQGQRDADFAMRMFEYYIRIWSKYNRSIVAFAIYTDGSKAFTLPCSSNPFWAPR